MHNERGMGLVEVLVASLLTSIVVGGVLTMLSSMQFTYADMSSRTSAAQATRMAMSWIQRDLIMAGVGLTPMTPVFPLLAPRQGGGITIRYNSNATTALIQQDTASRDTVAVPSTFGGRVGNYVIVYDSIGNFDLTLISQYQPGSTQLNVGPNLARDYSLANGSAIARVEQIQYWLDGTTLMRQVDNNAAAPIAESVTNFQIRYFDDQSPPVEFTPVTDAAQMRIRVIEVVLETETENDQVQTGARPAFELRSRLSPRALSISRS